MIALDTNVLIRYLVADDAAQFRTAARLIETSARNGESCLINDIVLCETAWVLESAYGYGKDAIVEAFATLASVKNFEFEDRDMLLRTITDYKTGKANFSDYLIGNINANKGAATTHTFDKALKGARGFSVLK